MNRASTQTAMRRIEEARNDRYEIFGHEDQSLREWIADLAEAFGNLATDANFYHQKSVFNRKDLLHAITADAATVGAICAAVMEQCEVMIEGLNGPRIREFQQVAIGEDRTHDGINTTQESESS
jgi:hypothetical protein